MADLKRNGLCTIQNKIKIKDKKNPYMANFPFLYFRVKRKKNIDIKVNIAILYHHINATVFLYKHAGTPRVYAILSMS